MGVSGFIGAPLKQVTEGLQTSKRDANAEQREHQIFSRNRQLLNLRCDSRHPLRHPFESFLGLGAHQLRLLNDLAGLNVDFSQAPGDAFIDLAVD